ncbi:histidine-rich glycoprotein-like [Harmonia axyridis]|uniref:histidine-rich glycoprotein-like n=1 Tax=Harmonia axyridis TaxID=115357 RepID=UPI001E2779C9|nr:histidine-rich glycoprotein-like [Harmonia axyridis]
MELWIHIALFIFIQNFVQPIKVDDSNSQFLIVENPVDRYPKDELVPSREQNNIHYYSFSSNKSNPRIKSKKKFSTSNPNTKGINLLGLKNIEEKVKQGGTLLSPSVKTTPTLAQFPVYSSQSNKQNVPSFSNQPIFRSTEQDRPSTAHSSKKHTHVKLPTFQKQNSIYSDHTANSQKSSNIENTISRPKTSDFHHPEKAVYEYFSQDLGDLIENAKQLEHPQVGRSRKHRNSEDSIGQTSDNYEVEEYPDHQPYLEHDGEYHVYHGEKKKKKEVHYHQHKHLHEHDHNQKHNHNHQGEHHHDHRHDQKQKHTHLHGHDDNHWHDHHEKGQHHHKSHHNHDHHGSHDHKHSEDHDHKHDNEHHHGHEDHHDHHEDHKNWHSHKHHSDHDHRHGHDHKHNAKHGHDHHHSNKHKHNHQHKHAGKH